MKLLLFTKQEARIILEMAKSNRQSLEEIHSCRGTCFKCGYDASIHYWPNGTCPNQSTYTKNPRRFSPAAKFVTKYDSIIEKLQRST